MPHVLVAGKIHEAGLEILRAAPETTFDYVDDLSEASYAELVDRADALVIRTQPLTAATVARAARLRIVSRHGVGYDSVDLEALEARGIALAIVGDVNSVSVAEHAMMMILAAAKRALRADRAVRQGHWNWRNELDQRELAAKHLLILGYGRIGQHLGRMAAAFGMKVRAVDPYLAGVGWPQGAAEPTELAAGLRWADVVSVNMPRVDRPVIGAAELAMLKPGGILVNTARGGIVDEPALIDALRAGRLAAAGLDVFDEEPPALDHPLLAMDQVILSPHVAGLSVESAERMAVASVRNALDFLSGRIDPALLVTGARPDVA